MKISKFTLAIILIGISFLILRFGIYPPIPSSLLYFYLGIAIFAIFLFISISNQSLQDFFKPIKSTILDKNRKPLKIILFVGLPILASAITFENIFKEINSPAELRSIHPAPPSEIQFRGKRLNLIGLENPLRKDKKNYEKYVEEGAKIYFQNCFFCHGDNLDGKGHFAHALNPVPANFVDKGTIAQLQESYVFWRISKGGPGLPNEGTPWNSAMPIWENILTENEIWKVIIFIYEASGVGPRTWEENPIDMKHQTTIDNSKHNDEINKKEDLQKAGIGKLLYLRKCQYCHGITGKGDGPAAKFLSPIPRDLTKARYKLKSTIGGELPTDNDIFNIISNGIRGTSMPAWRQTLSDEERWQLVKYIKTLAKRFKRAAEKGKPEPMAIKIKNPAPTNDESINKGKILFKKLECIRCHGENGRGNGSNALTLKDDWGHYIRPANLSKYWMFKNGYQTKDIYKTITTGLAGTPMPNFIDSATNEERWHLANYVKSIGPGAIPKKSNILKSHFINANLPETLTDPIWDSITPSEFPLFGQILIEPRLFRPSIDTVYVKSIFNNNEIAFFIEWDDISKSALNEMSSVNEKTLPDEIFLQFPNHLPQTVVSERPYFLMGDKTLGVNLWNWNSFNAIKELNANGINNKKEQEENNIDIKGNAINEDGRYKLFFKRELFTNDKANDIQFELNKFIPIGFFVRDGYNKETDTKMAISSWYNLYLEKGNVGHKIVYSILAGLTIVLLEFIISWQVKKS